MPTLTYSLNLKCENCSHEQRENFPVGSPFDEYQDIGYAKVDSGYYKNYGKAEKKTIKRCDNCRTACLVRKEV